MFQNNSVSTEFFVFQIREHYTKVCLIQLSSSGLRLLLTEFHKSYYLHLIKEQNGANALFLISTTIKRFSRQTNALVFCCFRCINNYSQLFIGLLFLLRENLYCKFENCLKEILGNQTTNCLEEIEKESSGG